MGLFNFIYKLTNILSNKRKIKVFIIIALIILLLFWWSRGAFAADANPTDTNALMNYQLILQQSFVDYMRSMKKTNQVDDTNFRNLLSILKNHHIYIVPGYEDNVQYDVYVYQTNIVIGSIHRNTADDFTLDGYWELGFVDGTSPTVYSGTRYPCKIGEFYGGHFQIFHYGTVSPNPSNGQWGFNFHIPDGCFMVRSHCISEFLNEFNVFNEVPVTYNTNDEELQSLTQAGFANEVNAINNATSAINDVNSSVEDVNDSVMQMIEEITNPYVNVTQQQLPSQEVNDTSEEPLNTLFDYIRNAFTGEPTGFSLPLPFVGGEVRIEPDAIQTSMRNARTRYIGYNY